MKKEEKGAFQFGMRSDNLESKLGGLYVWLAYIDVSGVISETVPQG